MWVDATVANLGAVVVDEVHAFASDDRGRRLHGVLSRIEALSGRNTGTLAALIRVAPERLSEASTGDHYGITLSSEAILPEIRRAMSQALERATAGEDVFALLLDERALCEVKVGDMVPGALLRAEIAQR